MALSNTQTVALQLEKVRDKLPLLYERDDTFFSMIQKRDVEKVSSRTMRVPLQIRPGGRPGFASFDGGDLGRGSGTAYDVATLTPIGLRFAVEVTKLVEFATNASEKAVEDATKREVANAMREFRTHVDCWLQTAGNGVLGTVQSVAGSVLTLSATPFKNRLLRFDQIVQIYDPTLTTNRGSSNITAIDYGAGTITLASVPGSTAANDLVVVDGVSGASPVFLYGIPYHHSDAATGTWLGLNRATTPEVRANVVNAGGAMMTLPPLRLAINKIRQRVGANALAKLRVHVHPAQKAAYEELAIVISEIEKGGGNEDVDLLFGNARIAGFPVIENIHADPTRVDFINLEAWGRAEAKPIDFYELGGQTVFPVYGSSGGLAAAYLFYYVTMLQFFVDNPAAVSSVTNLAVPAGY